MRADRIPCVVPFCRRTTARAEFDEWICGDHWKLIPKDFRRAYGRIVRQWRRYSPGPLSKPLAVRGARLWRRLRQIAIERAAGI